MSAITNLNDFLCSNRDYIVEEMRRQLNELPPSTWVDFVLQTKEGQRRLNTWVDLVLKSLEGDPELFLQDQERIAYSRAVQEIEFKHSYELYGSFQKIVGDLLHRVSVSEKASLAVLCSDIHRLNEVLLQAYSGNAASYLRIRQEQINEKVTNLEELYHLAHKIMTITGLEELVNVVLTTNGRVFQVEETCLAICKNDRIQRLFSCNSGKVSIESGASLN